MPRLLLLAACEKVIISKDENTPTLVGLLSTLTFDLPRAAIDQARNAAEKGGMKFGAPFFWTAFTLWQRTESDDRPFNQRIELVGPSRTVLIKHEDSFEMKNDQHRTIVRFPAFPLEEDGVHELRVALDDTVLATYPLEVKVITTPVATPAN